MPLKDLLEKNNTFSYKNDTFDDYFVVKLTDLDVQCQCQDDKCERTLEQLTNDVFPLCSSEEQELKDNLFLIFGFPVDKTHELGTPLGMRFSMGNNENWENVLK